MQSYASEPALICGLLQSGNGLEDGFKIFGAAMILVFFKKGTNLITSHASPVKNKFCGVSETAFPAL
jgi:hypothetical protein